MAPKWPPCRTAPEYFQYPAGRFISPPSPPLILSTSRRHLSVPPLLHRSPTLSRVHSCLLVARTSLPAVNGFLFHPCLPISLLPSLAPSPPSSAPSLPFYPFSFFFSLFPFFKSCRLTEARRSFISSFSGPVFFGAGCLRRFRISKKRGF